MVREEILINARSKNIFHILISLKTNAIKAFKTLGLLKPMNISEVCKKNIKSVLFCQLRVIFLQQS